MPTLVISAPSSRAKNDNGYKSFKQILEKRIGPDFAIYRELHDRIERIIKTQRCQVVVLDKDKSQRAEGTLRTLKNTGHETTNHIQLYDIHIDADLKKIDWIEPPERLNRCGIAFID